MAAAVRSLTVALEAPTDADTAAALADAIAMMKGVAAVTTDQTPSDHWAIEQQLRLEFKRKNLQAVGAA